MKPIVESVYIHIPFCKNICSYCDFSKMFYNKDLVSNYLEALKKEIKSSYKGELIKTIYIGGGSPSSLDLYELNKLKEIISIFNFNKKIEFTIEVNISDIEEDKLKFYKNMGVNRISIGIQTINVKFLKILNRYHTREEMIKKINLVKKYFSNISADFMYGFNTETFSDLKNDLDFFKSLDINHISIYSLILEEHTKLHIDKYKKIDEDKENKMYYYIIDYLDNIGFNHYEISNFEKNNNYSRHNLVYWNNDRYYGFGLGSSGYINNIRYTNTRSIKKYIDGRYLLDREIINKNIDMENEMILGLRKIQGVSKEVFNNKFSCNIEEVFDIGDLLKNKLLIDNGKYIYIPKDRLYVENSILVKFIGGSKND